MATVRIGNGTVGHLPVKTRQRNPDRPAHEARSSQSAGTVQFVPDTPPPQPNTLRSRLLALARELSKFGAVGAIAFSIDLVIFNVLLAQDQETLVAKTISTTIATTFAFLGNRFWTWRHREHSNMGKQYAVFFFLNAVGLGIGLSCLAISHYGLGQIWPVLQSRLADNISGQLIGTVLGTMFRFWSYRRFVFRDNAVAEPAPHS
jgi:putative flippase GtrA